MSGPNKELKEFRKMMDTGKQLNILKIFNVLIRLCPFIAYKILSPGNAAAGDEIMRVRRLMDKFHSKNPSIANEILTDLQDKTKEIADRFEKFQQHRQTKK